MHSGTARTYTHFWPEEAIVNALKIRFDGLLIHSKMYYTSYHNAINREEFLNATAIGKNGELDPTGLQQDCLGISTVG